LTPPSAQHPTSKSPWQTQALVSPELDQAPAPGGLFSSRGKRGLPERTSTFQQGGRRAWAQYSQASYRTGRLLSCFRKCCQCGRYKSISAANRSLWVGSIRCTRSCTRMYSRHSGVLGQVGVESDVARPRRTSASGRAGEVVTPLRPIIGLPHTKTITVIHAVIMICFHHAPPANRRTKRGD
jgi:hypothetical protein